MRPLCLVGMSGVGKSFWARRLAEEAGYERHDCDAAIAARLASLVVPAAGEEPVRALGRWMGMPWSEGYAAREARYLALEEEVTREALERALEGARAGRAGVIDATGSAIYLPDALTSRVRASTRVIYLRTPDARRDAMLRRYLDEPKPVVWGGAFRARDGERPEDALPRCYAELLAWRDARYAALAHGAIDAGELESGALDVAAFLALARGGGAER